MADRWAVATGNWSNTATWNGGTLPGASDDVYADGKTVTIDQDVTVLSLRTTQRSGGTAGGGFTVSSGGRTVTCTGLGVVQGTSNAITFSAASPNTLTVVGYCVGGATVNGGAVVVSSSGTAYITGDCTGGSVSGASGVRLAGSGTVYITGNCTGGNAQISSGAHNASTGTIVVVGDAIGAGGGNRACGVYNASSGNVTITGTLTPSSVAPGAANDATGLVIHVGSATVDANGQTGWGTGRWLVRKTGAVSYAVRAEDAGSTGDVRELVTLDDTGQASEADVRDGVTYAGGARTGTLAVPPPSAVGVGVPTDDTVGTAALSASAIRDAVGLASANLDTQLSAVKSDTAAVLEDTGTTLPAQVAGLNNLSAAQVNAEVDTALADYDPPTNAEMVARTLAAGSYATASALGVVGSDVLTNGSLLALMAGSGFDTSTDSLAALRDRGDAAWTTAAGFSTLTASGVRDAVGLATNNLDTQLSAIKSDTAAVLDDTGTSGVVLAANAVTSAKVADGAFTDAKFALPAEATGTPSTLLQLVMWLAGQLGWRKIKKDADAGTLTQYMADGTTVKTTSTFTTVGNVDTVNKAS